MQKYTKKGIAWTLGSMSLLQKKLKGFMSELDEEVKEKKINEKIDQKIDRLIEKFDNMGKKQKDRLAHLFGVATKSDLEKLREEIKKSQ
ncbi:MAG: hypothetical protein M1501_03335 [Candidatus Omnitrophica bacterium]|nr:hypothetical protein [Candidatus Omnitrophota bacterium]